MDLARPADRPDTIQRLSESLPRLTALVHDIYLEAVYDRQAFVQELTEGLLGLGVRRILDCAAGTGFPALDLHLTGAFESVHCTDGSQAMIDQLRLNARARAVPTGAVTPPHRQAPADDPMCVRWQDLPRLARSDYDYVLCRGNSLVYLDTWSEANNVAAEHRISSSLRAIGSRVRVGGRLHIDGPKELKSYPSWHVASFSCGRDDYVLRERVTMQESSRQWDLSLSCESEHQGVRFHNRLQSAPFDISHLEKLVDPYCFTTSPLMMSSERPQFGIVIAEKINDDDR